MTHFTVLVAFKRKPEHLATALDEVMGPYSENLEVEPYLNGDGEETTWNPEGRWDWYSVGGRWSGYFPGTQEARNLAQFAQAGNEGRGYPMSNGLVLGFDERTTRMRFNAGPKGLLGLDILRDEKGLQAEKDWNEYASVVFGTPKHLPWSHFVDRVDKAEQDRALECGETWHTFYDRKVAELKAVWGWETEEAFQAFLEKANADPEARKTYDAYSEAVRGSRFRDEWAKGLNYTIAQAREDYRDQPRIKRLREAEEYKRRWIMEGPEQEFEEHTRDEYIVRQRNGAVPGYAFIGPDGLWRAPGEMGWWGMSSEEDGDKTAFQAHVNKVLDEMPDETYLVLLDAHV